MNWILETMKEVQQMANKSQGKSKKAKTYKGKSLEPGGGGRFQKLVDQFMREGDTKESAEAKAAAIGRAKYGKQKFQQMAAKGRKNGGK